MAKLFGGKKKQFSTRTATKSKAKSPLMAEEGKSSSSSRSRLSRDGEKDVKRKERNERRKKRDDRLNAPKASSSSSKSKKKSKPKPSQKEQDLQDSQLGCWHKTQQILVKTIHVLDALIGVTLVVYGSLILTQFEEPAMEAAITTLAFGSTLLFASIMGVVGFYSRICNRCGLIFSGFTAPFISLAYLLMVILLLADIDKVSNYLTEHKDVLYLNDAEVLILGQILPFFYIVFLSLAAIEMIRFVVLLNVRQRLVRYDAANRRIHDSTLASDRSNRSSSKKSSRSGSKTSGSSRSDSSRTHLTEPLMGDEEEGSGGDSNDY